MLFQGTNKEQAQSSTQKFNLEDTLNSLNIELKFDKVDAPIHANTFSFFDLLLAPNKEEPELFDDTLKSDGIFRKLSDDT